MPALRVFFHGMVQGVGMRYFVKRCAERHRLSGYVRNLADGRVEALLEGARETIEAALRAMREGPASGLVTDISLEWLPDPPAHSEFRIVH